MKKSLLFILLLAISCNNTKEQKELPISDLKVDFPVGDTIIFNLKQKFKIAPYIYGCNILDSVIFIFENSKENIGHCYNINSGEVLSVIANIGRANNEINPDMIGTGIETNNIIFDDSIMLHTRMGGVTKTFLINDILTKPASERKCSKTERLLIQEDERRKIGNGITFGTYGYGNYLKYEPYKMFFISDEKDSISFFGDLKTEFFNIKDTAEIKRLTHSYLLTTNYKNKVFASFYMGLYFNIVDVDKKSIEHVRSYDKIELKEETIYHSKYNLRRVNCNEKYIVCLVSKENRQKYKAQREISYDMYLLVYDWELNPIKRFNLGEARNDNEYNYYIAEDCKYIYFLDKDEEKQEQQLMFGEINI